MKKRALKRIAVLTAPIIWRRIRGQRGHHSRRGYRGWHGCSHHFGHKRRDVWL